MLIKLSSYAYFTMRNLTIGVSSPLNNRRRTYDEAVQALNGLQSNAATLEKTRNQRDGRDDSLKLEQTARMASRAEITPEEIDRLSIIHVSGTKGKGSTCAFTESILRNCGYSTGFFSSPHLVEVRERIRINGKPLSKDAFSTYFWDVYTKLDKTKAEHDNEMPAYFKFLTIMAFHVFLQEKVDVAIMEVGIGGQYDCTNIIRHPVVCGVSSLGIDHTSILGSTIDRIAWQKGGIFKCGTTAVTVPQPHEAMQVLRDRARERQCLLNVAPSFDDYPCTSGVHLGIAGEMQKVNASLALQLCKIWIQNHSLNINARQQLCEKELKEQNQFLQSDLTFTLAPVFLRGLKECKWAGRNQVLKQPHITYYIDGAHTTSSIEQCVDWFSEASATEEMELGGRVARVLLFNVTGERSPRELLQYFVDLDFDAAVFCPNIASTSNSRADQENLTVTRNSQCRRCLDCQQTWQTLMSSATSCSPDYRSGSSSPEYRETNRASDHFDSANSESAVSATPKSKQELVQNSSELNLCASPILSEISDADSGLDTSSAPTSARAVTPMTSCCEGHVFDCITDALQWISQGTDANLPDYCDKQSLPQVPEGLKMASHVQVLCSGSLHLIGGILGVLDPNLNSHDSSCASSRDSSPDVTCHVPRN